MANMRCIYNYVHGEYNKDKGDAYIVLDDKRRISKPILTTYEKTRIISERTTQLVNGAKPMILLSDPNISEEDIAKLELANNAVPFSIVRTMPNNTKEKWELHELLKLNEQ